MSSAKSYKVALAFESCVLKALPIDCRLRTLDLVGEAKITLCRFFILIPVLKVPYDAKIIALSEDSHISRTSSRSVAGTPP